MRVSELRSAIMHLSDDAEVVVCDCRTGVVDKADSAHQCRFSVSEYCQTGPIDHYINEGDEILEISVG